ncbi:MAG TPA: NAD(P)H-dependent oxidoreductase [Chthoniobacterales bacterium]
MSTLTKEEQLLTQLRWRYATKQFDPTKKVPVETWLALEEALVLTPSSYGLQPWKFLVITDPTVREQLKPASRNQSQITDASHLVVFAVFKENTREHTDAYIRSISAARGVPTDQPPLVGFKDMLNTANSSRPNLPWNKNQVYIALGNFLTAAAILGVDTCPIEGFDPEKYDEILGLGAKNLTSAVVAAVGYRAESDRYASLAKVRFPKTDVVEYV